MPYGEQAHRSDRSARRDQVLGVRDRAIAKQAATFTRRVPHPEHDVTDGFVVELRRVLVARVRGKPQLPLADGAGVEGAVMRGAVLMDATTGERLEIDSSRGVRVSRMDLSPECRPALELELTSSGLGHHRVLEALVLAGKVLGAPGIVAELCWSDDPDYTIGYVADPQKGYQRISALKATGDSRGGRVFFVKRDKALLEEIIAYLQHQAVLFNAFGTISPSIKWKTSDG